MYKSNTQIFEENLEVKKHHFKALQNTISNPTFNQHMIGGAGTDPHEQDDIGNEKKKKKKFQM